MSEELKDLAENEMASDGNLAEKRREEKLKKEKAIRLENRKLKKKMNKNRGTFDRKKLNGNFFTNAKQNTDLGTGWAMDFTAEESGVSIPKGKSGSTIPSEDTPMKIQKNPNQISTHAEIPDVEMKIEKSDSDENRETKTREEWRQYVLEED